MEGGSMTDPVSGTATVAPMAPVHAGQGGGTAGTVAAVVASVAAAEPASATLRQADLPAIAAALNQRAQDLQTSLHFQVDQVTGQMVISVIDTRDNRVLMQAPSQEALAIAQSLERLQMQLMKQSA
jgi:flagellar protein FlaG